MERDTKQDKGTALVPLFHKFLYFHQRQRMEREWRSVFVTSTNTNSHAWIERLAEAEKAEALLRLINEYRVYTQRFAQLPTWDILEFLQKLDNEVNERYNKEVKDAEREKIKEQYFLLTHKKPFLWWSNERILEEMEKFKKNNWWEVSKSHLDVKKSEWKKVLRKQN